MKNNNKLKSKQSKMTLDKLALMMGRGFNEAHERINTLDEKFSNKFDEVDRRFDAVDKRFEEMDNKFDEMVNTQDTILKDIEDLRIENVMDMAFRDRFNNLEQRVEVIERKTN